MTPYKSIYLYELLDDLRRENVELDSSIVDLCQALQNIIIEGRAGHEQ